jgi:hypothetical protein
MTIEIGYVDVSEKDKCLPAVRIEGIVYVFDVKYGKDKIHKFWNTYLPIMRKNYRDNIRKYIQNAFTPQHKIVLYSDIEQFHIITVTT